MAEEKYSTKKIVWLTSVFALLSAGAPSMWWGYGKVMEYNQVIETYKDLGNFRDTMQIKEAFYGTILTQFETDVKEVHDLIDSSGLSKEKFNRIEVLLENLSSALVGELDKHSYGGISIYKSNVGTEFYYKKYLWPATMMNGRYIYFDLDGRKQYCH